MLGFLSHCVRARLNCLISGGTGAGKTTLLNVLSGFITERERIVTIEDAAELQLRQDHVVRLETRPPNIEGKGAVRQRQLVINALRMRPDRIVIGEVRGEEALDMLQAMNTGHDGSLTTVHANSARDALTRIETMVSMAIMNLPEKAIRQQIATAIHLVVQQARMSDGSRKVTSISEITGMEGWSHYHAGDLLVREIGRQSGGQGGRALPGHRRAPEVPRAAASIWHSPARRNVRRGDRGALMPALLIALLVFALVAGSIVGVCFLAMGTPGARLRRRVQDRLQQIGLAGAGGQDQTEAGDLVKTRPAGPLPTVDRVAGRTWRGFKVERWIQQSGAKMSISAVLLTSFGSGSGIALLTWMLIGAVGDRVRCRRRGFRGSRYRAAQAPEGPAPQVRGTVSRGARPHLPRHTGRPCVQCWLEDGC